MSTGNRTKKIPTLILCGIAGSVIYKLPYLRETYYTALMEATGTTNAQLGMLMGAYGIVNLILYLPSGYFADRFSARKLMTFSLVATGLLGFLYGALPSFPLIVAIHCAWGFTAVFTFWTACIRIIRVLGNPETQGRYYGIWTLLRGTISIAVGFISVYIFSSLGEGVSGLKGTIWFYAGLCIAVGIACWFLIDDDVKNGEKSSFRVSDMVHVMKMPKVWICGFIAMAVWICYTTFSYVTPYLTQIYGLSETQTALVSNIRAYVLFAVGGLLAAFLADRMKSRALFLGTCFVGIMVFSIFYAVLPKNLSVGVVIVVMIIMGTGIYCGNAVFYSVIDECAVPIKYAGTAAGIVSAVAYSTDTFLWTVTGSMLDAVPGAEGYRNLFTLQTIAAGAGIILCFGLHFAVMKERKKM